MNKCRCGRYNPTDCQEYICDYPKQSNSELASLRAHLAEETASWDKYRKIMNAQLDEWVDTANKLRSQLAEALANEQSSATAYAESQAREDQMTKRIQELTNDLGKCENERKNLLLELSSVVFTLKALKDSDSSTRRTLIEFALARIEDLPAAPDLVGVIKELSAALEYYASTTRWENTTHESTFDGIGCGDFDSFKEIGFGPYQVGGRTARNALSSTREIRERIGAG